MGRRYKKGYGELLKKVNGISHVANILEIREKSGLMKYIPPKKVRYDTNFEDDILSMDWREAKLHNDDLKNYKAKAEYGDKPLGEFVREIVGLDMNAAKEAFGEYLNGANLDSRQIYFVNQIVEYVVHNGLMKDLSVLQGAPFTDQGSVAEVFADMSVWMGIRKVIEGINANARAA